MRIGTPVNQVRLTNVAYVRLSKGGKRFEIACYRNKILSWRNKQETDLGEVLQIDTVFTNVSKGLLASAKDLQDAFGTADQRAICKEILDKGELQVSEQERSALTESTFRDIATIVVDKSINPVNKNPYTLSMIQNAMRQIHFSVNLSKSAKSQALDVIRRLKEVMPIARACMLLRIVCSESILSEMRQFLHASGIDIVGEGAAAHSSSTLSNAEASTQSSTDAPSKSIFLDITVDPELYRKVEEVVQNKTRGEGRVEVLQLRTSASSSRTGASEKVMDEAASAHDAKPSSTADAGNVGGGGVKKSTSSGVGKGKQKKLDSSLMEAVSRINISNESDEEDEHIALNQEDYDNYVLEALTKKGGKKKKGKNKKGSTERGAEDLQDPDAMGGEDKKLKDHDDDDSIEDGMDSDGGNEGDSRSAAVAADVAGNISKTTKLHSTEAPAGSGNKKGKKSKRIEKEERKERELRVQKLQTRLDLEQQSRQQATATSSNLPPQPPSLVTGESNASNTASEIPSQAPSLPPPAPANTSNTNGGKALSRCNTCGGNFEDTAAYRAHFKSEWHSFNLKRKMKNLPIVSSEEEFRRLPLEDLEITVDK